MSTIRDLRMFSRKKDVSCRSSSLICCLRIKKKEVRRMPVKFKPLRAVCSSLASQEISSNLFRFSDFCHSSLVHPKGGEICRRKSSRKSSKNSSTIRDLPMFSEKKMSHLEAIRSFVSLFTNKKERSQKDAGEFKPLRTICSRCVKKSHQKFSDFCHSISLILEQFAHLLSVYERKRKKSEGCQ